MKKKYIICSPSYDEHFGGIMVLHNICERLNKQDQTAYMCPIDNRTIYFEYKGSVWKTILYRLLHIVSTIRHFRWWRFLLKDYKTNPLWNTPLITPWTMLFNVGLDDYIILYSDVVNGNPIGAKNVTRLLMHNPGHFSGEINYGNNELIFRYSNSFARDFVPPFGSVLSSNLIKINTYPQAFSCNGIECNQRKGAAYCIRKGKGKTMVHNMENAILIDNKSLAEVASIFKRVKMFVSYDPITAFSFFSLLCHCPSVIILGNDETPETYYPDNDQNSRYAYSIEEASHKNWNESYAWAEGIMKRSNEESEVNLCKYIEESQSFFIKRNR